MTGNLTPLSLACWETGFSDSPEQVPFSQHYTPSNYFNSVRQACLHGLFSGYESTTENFPAGDMVQIFLFLICTANAEVDELSFMLLALGFFVCMFYLIFSKTRFRLG